MNAQLLSLMEFVQIGAQMENIYQVNLALTAILSVKLVQLVQLIA